MIVICENIPGHTLCFGKALQNVLDNCFHSISFNDLVDRVRAFVKQFDRLKDPGSLHKDQQDAISQVRTFVPDLWTSMYDMLDVVRSKYDMLSGVLVESGVTMSKNIDVLLSVYELEDLENVLHVLGPLRTATLAMIEQESPTASIILPVIKQLVGSIEATNFDAGSNVDLKDMLLEQLSSLSYTDDSDIDDTLTICTTLDPRFKNLPFLHEGGKASRLIVDAAAKRAENQAASGNSTKRDGDLDSSPPQSPHAKRIRRCEYRNDSDNLAVSSNREVTKASAMCMLFQRTLPEQDTSFSDTNHLVLNELNRYLYTESNVPLNGDINAWWRIRTGIYPQLSSLAKIYLSLPATVSAPATIFTDVGRKEEAKRSHLESDVMNNMIFLHHNMDHMVG